MIHKELLTIKYDNSIITESGLKVLDVIRDNIPELREYNGIKKFCIERMYANYEYSGVVSPKFKEKTGLTIKEALEYVDGSVDVILFHPYPLELKLQNNFVQLAELEHPGMAKKLDKLWRMIFNEDLPYIKLPENILVCCHCNYFIANNRFWDEYSSMIHRIDEMYKNGELDEFIYEDTPYNLSKNNEKYVSFFPFMFERMLSHFIYKNRSVFTINNVSLNNNYKPVNIFKYEDVFINFLRRLFFINSPVLSGFKTKLATRVYYYIRKFVFILRRLSN